MKESFPVEVAEYVVGNKISEEPAFAWWVSHVLRKRDRIIHKVAAKYWKRTHKFGIELPHTVEEALEIDRKTGTTFWRDSIEKEMKNVRIAFEFKDDDVMPVSELGIQVEEFTSQVTVVLRSQDRSERTRVTREEQE